MNLETFNEKFYEFETVITDPQNQAQVLRFRVPISDHLASSIRECLSVILTNIYHRPIEWRVAAAIDKLKGPMWISNVDQRLLTKPYVLIRHKGDYLHED